MGFGWLAFFVVCTVVWAFFLVGKDGWLVKSVVYGALTCVALGVALVLLKLAVVVLKFALVLAPIALVAAVVWYLFFREEKKVA